MTIPPLMPFNNTQTFADLPATLGPAERAAAWARMYIFGSADSPVTTPEAELKVSRLASFLEHVITRELSRRPTEATIKADWKMPPAPVCSFHPNTSLVATAYHTGEGWSVSWECPEGCALSDDDALLDAWPFYENSANAKDMRRAGFVVI